MVLSLVMGNLMLSEATMKNKHNLSGKRIYTAWCNMKSRCYNVKHKDYFIKASLSPYAIKKIYAHIVEIENSDLEEKEEE